MKISMFSTHKMKYIWYLLKKVYFFSFCTFLEDLQLINLLTIKPNHNNVKEDKGVLFGNFAFLFNCTPVGRTSDSMMVPT